MTNYDMITLTELEQIAEKIDGMKRILDFDGCDVGLNERESRIVKAIGKVSRMGLHAEFRRLNHKINTHHHVTLNTADGIIFRDNGNSVLPASPVE